MGELSVQSFYPNQKLDWSYNTKLYWMEMCELYKGNYITYAYEKDGMGKYKIIGDCYYCNYYYIIVVIPTIILRVNCIKLIIQVSGQVL